ncbi:MAG: type IX secretion system membrane protein PorP/SprF [Chitinophagales bacterium]
MKRYLLRVFVFLLTIFSACLLNGQSGIYSSVGQQDPQFTQYMFNPAYFNPAAAGVEGAWISTLNVRNQWVNLPGAPISQIFTSQLPVYKLSGGAGVSIINDIAGQQRNTGATIFYAYHKSFKKSILSFGLSGGIVQETIDGSKLVTPTGNYENIIDHNDPNLPVTLNSNLLPDASAGIYFFGKNLSAGISAAHIIAPFLKSGDQTVTSTQYNPDAYVYLAYRIGINDKIDITPNVLYKTDLIESIVDVSAIFSYNRNILAGLAFRGYANSQYDAIAVIAGLNITDKWRISYSYDITTSELNSVSAGSHEIVLKYSLPVSKPRAGKMINNPRFIYH